MNTDRHENTPDANGAFNSFRRARSDDDFARIDETITLAFSDDPSWAPLLVPNPDDLQASQAYWHLFVNSARKFNETFTNDEGSVAAVWLPPGASELTSAEEAALEDFLLNLFGPATTKKLFSAFEAFEKATPTSSFYYLSLLGVHPARRNLGLGMQLLRSNLERLDEMGSPSYLESSNPINDRKYQSLGYEKYSSFRTPSGTTISTFWRDPR